ncbi:MAG: hypothetical protein ACFFAN_15075 [Promethearchaeota archaeon]
MKEKNSRCGYFGIEKFPKALPAYYSEEFNIQFFICPDCLEFIEGDMCYICGQIYDISATKPEIVKQEEKIAQLQLVEI